MPGRNSPKKDNRAALRSAEQAVRSTRDELRAQVCTGPKYPGKPEDYTYVLSESCRPNRKKKEGAKASGEKNISPSATKKEIKRIEEALETEFGPGHIESTLIDGKVMAGMVTIFDIMIRKESRLRFPDPIVRMKEIVDSLVRKKRMKANNVPRFTVLELVLQHLLRS